MESGLDGRNNPMNRTPSWVTTVRVSMESGLDGRNKRPLWAAAMTHYTLSQWSPA